MYISRKISAGIATGILVAGMVGGATPAAHSSDQHVDSYGVSSVNLPEMDSRFLLKAPEAPEGKQWYKGESLRETATDIDNGATVYLNPVTIGLCNAGFGDKKVKTFNSKNDGEITLYCGDSNSGYVHIRERHESQWESQKGGFEGPWDDYMAFATQASLESPAYSAEKPSQKRCYTTPIEVYEVVNGAPVKKKTINPTVMISMNNKKVITSYPTTTHRC